MRKCGILVHPISFPSKFGIGDMGPYCKDFIDYMVRGSQKLWQILPLGHTGFGDSPYQSFSTFAGNPLMISPEILAEKGYISAKDIEHVPYFNERKIEYGSVINYKYDIFRKAFKGFRESKDAVLTRKYNAFCNKNAFWLEDYSLFMSLKYYFIDKRKNTWESPEYKAYYRTASKYMGTNAVKDCFYGGSWNSFPADIRDRKPEAVEKYSKLLKNDMDFYKFLQFEFYAEWAEVRKYANDKGIEIIGDIPIFVAGDSSDTWANRELFHINTKGFTTQAAGVPPDYFSKDGQLWGNPLYNWKNHKAQNYDWWVKRVEKILELVDIVRIDHFRAFESYWSIPSGEKTAVNGKWKKGPGAEVFKAIERELGSLHIIAEDLGDLNPEVLELRDELGLPGMKIIQFAFGSPDNPYLPHNFNTDNCIAYTGTHDNDTTIGWYKSCYEDTKDFVRRMLNVSGDNINWDLIRYTISSSAKYAIIPIQDIIGCDTEDRMNTPGVADGNWQYRFKKEDLNQVQTNNLKYLCYLFNR